MQVILNIWRQHFIIDGHRRHHFLPLITQDKLSVGGKLVLGAYFNFLNGNGFLLLLLDCLDSQWGIHSFGFGIEVATS